MKVGFHLFALLVDAVDLVAAPIHLDAADLPFLFDELLFELRLRLPARLRTRVARREPGRVRGRSECRDACKHDDDGFFHETPRCVVLESAGYASAERSLAGCGMKRR